MKKPQEMTPERIKLKKLYRAALWNAHKKEAAKLKAELALKIAYDRCAKYKNLLYPDGINREFTSSCVEQ